MAEKYLVQRENEEGETEWCLISKTTGRVLRWFGKSKPSDEVVAQAEREIHAAADHKNLFAEITKKFDDGAAHIVAGYASTEAVDYDGEIVIIPPEVIADYSRWANVREMHQPNAVGVVRKMEQDANGLYVEAEIVDETVWTKIKKGVLKGFSISFKHWPKIWDKAANAFRLIAKRIVEISVCDRPANPECIFSVIKFYDVEPEQAAKAAGGKKMDVKEKLRAAWATIEKIFDDGEPEVKVLTVAAAPLVIQPSPEFLAEKKRADDLATEVATLKAEKAERECAAKAMAMCADAHLEPKWCLPLGDYLAGKPDVRLSEDGKETMARDLFFGNLLAAKGKIKLDDPTALKDLKPAAKKKVEAVTLTVLMGTTEGQKLLADEADVLAKVEQIPVNKAMEKVLAQHRKEEVE